MAISTFLGLNTALSGILAQQRALDTVAHNIANAQKPGYTRQEAIFATNDPFRVTGAGQLGTGVTVPDYRRIRDAYLDIQLRAQTMLRGYQEARQDGLQQVELVLAEPSDSGLSTLIGRYWSAWQNVANAPENTATRQSLVQGGANLASGFKSLHAQLTTISGQANDAIALSIGDVNSLTARIAKLNEPIRQSVGLGETAPSDLLDERDQLIDDLSELVNLGVTREADGSVTLKVGTTTLVTGVTSIPVTSTADFVDGGGVNQLTSGKIKGLVDLQTTISGTGGYLERLNDVAAQLMTRVDNLQASGYALSGGAPTGIRFFSGTDASDIGVNSALLADPTLVAASDAPGQAGNGQNALTAAALRGNAAVDGNYLRLVTTIGSDTQDARRTHENLLVLTRSLQNRRDAVSGVSLDEEMMNLTRFQRGFAASARALSAMDEMIDMLINRTGRVGL